MIYFWLNRERYLNTNHRRAPYSLGEGRFKWPLSVKQVKATGKDTDRYFDRLLRCSSTVQNPARCVEF